MNFRFELVKGLFKPSIKAYQLQHSERLKGIIPNILILVLINFIIALLSSYFGFGSESLTTKIYQLTTTEFASYHFWLGVGIITGSIIKPLLFLFTLALIFMVFYPEIPFKKLLALQVYILLIGIIEKVLLFLLQFFIGLTPTTSPFSLGVIGQILFENSFLVFLMAAISLFLIWKIVFSVIIVRQITEQTKAYIFSSVIGAHLFIVLVDAAIKSLEVYKFI